MVKVKNADEIRNLVSSDRYDKKRIFSIVAHIDHGKSTTADFLLKRAGLMREEDAGKLQMTDTDDEEQARGITIFTSVVLLAFNDPREKDDKVPYIFQINDTPGHLSFTGEVSRALRSSDGAVVLVDALEGLMTQTETNIRLAVGEEMCRPVIFVNKVDRLISELRLEPKETYARIDKIINDCNDIIRQIQPKNEDWTCSFQYNSVAIGSAKDGWGFTYEILQDKGIHPLKVFEKYNEGDIPWLRKNLPLDDTLLRMIVDHLPDPITASKYRVKKLIDNVDWDSELGKSLMNSDRNGPLMGIISKIFIDPRSFRATLIGRIYSGTLKAGESVYLVGRKEKQRVKRLGIMELTDILDMPEVPAGNLFALFGFITPAGETFVGPELVPDKDDEDEEPPSFEKIKYACEAVVSRSIIPENPQDLAKLGDVVKKWLMADNTAKFHLEKESREYILSGIDPLQIEILTKRINEQVKIKVGEPIIVYREKITKEGQIFYTKSSNGHNRILMQMTPLDQATIDLINSGEVHAEMNAKVRAQILRDKAGWDAKEARKIWDVYEANILLDGTKGLQRLDRIKSYCVSAFRDWVSNAILAKEPALGLLCTFTDAEVHVDPAHTGYNEIASMMFSNLALGFLSANPKLFEPIQKVDIKVPAGSAGSIVKILSQHRGQIQEIRNEGAFERVIGKLPVAEQIGIADEFRGATQGKAFFGYEFLGFEPVPPHLQEQVIMDIRKRKGMPLQMPDTSSYTRFIYARK
ncbi:MAG: GTP-binding protein [Candidatus Lokiarchaeota archaeon]|nr:GTP-binding protein [Candidatus Lokiarchaeota archaeon]